MYQRTTKSGSRPHQVRKHGDLLNIQALFAVIPRSGNLDLDPVHALREAALVHVHLERAVSQRVELRQAGAVDEDEHLVGTPIAQSLGYDWADLEEVVARWEAQSSGLLSERRVWRDGKLKGLRKFQMGMRGDGDFR